MAPCSMDLTISISQKRAFVSPYMTEISVSAMIKVSAAAKVMLLFAVVFHFLSSVLQMKSNVMFIICL